MDPTAERRPQVSFVHLPSHGGLLADGERLSTLLHHAAVLQMVLASWAEETALPLHPLLVVLPEGDGDAAARAGALLMRREMGAGPASVVLLDATPGRLSQILAFPGVAGVVLADPAAPADPLPGPAVLVDLSPAPDVRRLARLVLHLLPVLDEMRSQAERLLPPERFADARSLNTLPLVVAAADPAACGQALRAALDAQPDGAAVALVPIDLSPVLGLPVPPQA